MRRESKCTDEKSSRKLFKYQYNAKKLRRARVLLGRAETYLEDNRLQQASLSYQQVLSYQSDSIPALIGLGDVASKSGMKTLALEFYKYAYEISPSDPDVNAKIADVCVMLERYDDAIFHYLYILHKKDDNPLIHGKLAMLNQYLGNMDIALQHYLVALESDPDQPSYLEGVLSIDPSRITDENIRKIEMNLAEDELSRENRCGFYFLLGQIYDARACYDQAFANFKVANICKGVDFDVHRLERYVTSVIDIYSDEFIATHASQHSRSEQPVFIVGLPCSGIIELDLLFDRHPDIFCCGDVSSIPDIAKIIEKKATERDATVLSAHDSLDDLLSNYARFYLNQINTISSDSGVRDPLKITGRDTENFLHIGLIATLFPQAAIIVCRRDPLETALSCYFEHFLHRNEFSYDPGNIVAYIRQYQRLIAHWENVLPGRIHYIEYEDIVSYPRSTTRKLGELLDIDIKNFDFTEDGALCMAKAHGGVQPDKVSMKSRLYHWQNYEAQASIFKEGISEIITNSPLQARIGSEQSSRQASIGDDDSRSK